MDSREQYDEDLMENQFFKTLRNKRTDLWKDAVQKKLFILIPQKLSLMKFSFSNEKVFMRHILDADPEREGHFYNLQGEEVVCFRQCLTLCSPPPKTGETSADEYETVKILFEETFFTEDDKSYRLLCISQPLTLSNKRDYRVHECHEATESSQLIQRTLPPSSNQFEKTVEDIPQDTVISGCVSVSSSISDPTTVILDDKVAYVRQEWSPTKPSSTDPGEFYSCPNTPMSPNGNGVDFVDDTEDDTGPCSPIHSVATLKISDGYDSFGGFDTDRVEEDVDYCLRTLFATEKDFAFQTYLYRTCRLFAQKINREYCMAWNVRTVVEMVSEEFKSVLHLVLRRKRRKLNGKLNAYESDALKLATEIFFFQCVGSTIVPLLRGCLAEEETELNRERNTAGSLTLSDLDATPAIYDSMPRARKQLSKLNTVLSPHAKLVFLRKAILALTPISSPTDSPAGTGAGTSDVIFSSDDLLPALVYLVLSTSSISDWSTNLVYMSDFHFSRASGDELGYCLASFEAAVEFIRHSSLAKIVQKTRLPAIDTMGEEDLLKLREDSSVQPFFTSNEEELKSMKDYILTMVKSGDDVGLADLYQQQEAMSAITQKLLPDIRRKDCHPLCDCERCQEARTGSSSENSSLTGGIFDEGPKTLPPPQNRPPYKKRKGKMGELLNLPLDRGRTALHFAALLDKTSVLNVICKQGADTDAVDDEGRSPLHHACMAGNQSSALLLLGMGARVEVTDQRGNQPLHTAVYFGNVHHVRGSRTKLNSLNNVGDTPLHLAVHFEYAEIVSVLLECGADPSVKNRGGKTPGDLCQNALIRRILVKQDPAIDFVMIDKRIEGKVGSNSDLNSTLSDDDFHSVKSHQSNDSSETPKKTKSRKSRKRNDDSRGETENSRNVEKFLKAVRDNDIPMVRHFVGKESGESLEAKMCHPLCQCKKCLDILMQNEALIDVNSSGEMGVPALHSAAAGGLHEMMKTLLSLGAKVEVKDTTFRRETPMHVAARAGNPIGLQILFEHGGSLTEKDSKGDQPLHVAAAKGQSSSVSMLCKLGASVNASNRMEDTPLHLAVKWERSSAVEALLFHGASVTSCNNMRLTPLDLARTAAIRHMLEERQNSIEK